MPKVAAKTVGTARRNRRRQNTCCSSNSLRPRPYHVPASCCYRWQLLYRRVRYHSVATIILCITSNFTYLFTGVGHQWMMIRDALAVCSDRRVQRGKRCAKYRVTLSRVTDSARSGQVRMMVNIAVLKSQTK